MKQAMLRVLTLVVLLTTAAGQVAAENRVALVIGNGAYEHAQPLANPVNDARLIGKILSQQGFEVLQYLNLDQKGMKRAVQEFTSKLEGYGKDTVGLIFYAGHGVQVNGRNFLLPIDADIGKEGDVEIESISSEALLSGVQLAGNRLNIIIYDACRDNPFGGLFRSASGGLARMDAPIGSLVAFSTAPGMVAKDGTGANSPYTAALAVAMAEPGRKLEEVFKAVRQQVYVATDGEQIPWESSSVLGDFYFTAAGTKGSPELAAPSRIGMPSPARGAGELALWNAVTEAGTKPAYEAYLAQYPNGTFAGLAHLLIEELTKPDEGANTEEQNLQPRPNLGTEHPTPPPLRPVPSEPAEADERAYELAYWNSIKDSTNPSEFRSYIKAYPDGAFLELARLRIKALEAEKPEAAAPRPPSPKPARATPIAPSGTAEGDPRPRTGSGGSGTHTALVERCRTGDRSACRELCDGGGTRACMAYRCQSGDLAACRSLCNTGGKGACRQLRRAGAAR